MLSANVIIYLFGLMFKGRRALFADKSKSESMFWMGCHEMEFWALIFTGNVNHVMSCRTTTKPKYNQSSHTCRGSKITGGLVLL